MKRLSAFLLLIACLPSFAGDPVVVPTTGTKTVSGPLNAASAPITVDVGKFIPMIPTVTEPLLYDFSDTSKAASIILPKGGSITGIRFDSTATVPTFHSFPDAKGQVCVLLAQATGNLKVKVYANGKDGQPPYVIQTVDVIVKAGNGPQPPPDPKPVDPVVPVDPTTPDPFGPYPGNKVLIVFPYNSPLTDGQKRIINGVDFRAVLESKAAPGDSGMKQYRIWADNVDASNTPDMWKKAYAAPRKSVPWIVIGNGTTGYAGPWTTEKEVQDLITKYWK